LCGEKVTNINFSFQAIISGGTINSPQILMLSGIGPKETLDRFNIPVIKNLPGVGQNLQNHVGAHLSFTLMKEQEVPELNWATAMEFMLQREGPLSATGLSQVTLTLRNTKKRKIKITSRQNTFTQKNQK
jgi:choline dehydrogenase-like flavoprotein